MSDKQCPVCLKKFSTAGYLEKHLFDNKKKCTPTPGYTPAVVIDYDKRTWTPVTRPVKKVITNREMELLEKERALLEKEARLKKLEADLLAKEKASSTANESPIIATMPLTLNPHRNARSHQGQDLDAHSRPQPKVEINGQTTGDHTEEITNNYTIAVDHDGNLIDVPNFKTNNDILKDNPVLQEQVKQVIKNLNLKKKDKIRLPPEIQKCQDGVDKALDEFCDVGIIIREGLKHPINQVDTIVSINPADEKDIQIERIYIPDCMRQDTDRELSFIEILYRGIYQVLSRVIAQKYQFFELTRSQKAYEDVHTLMKYRKLILTSHLVLKRRLDKLYAIQPDKPIPPLPEYLTGKAFSVVPPLPTHHHDPQLVKKLTDLHTQYYSHHIKNRHFPYSTRYNNSNVMRLMAMTRATSIEAQSLAMFYENLAHYVNLFDFKTIRNPACPIIREKDGKHEQHLEEEIHHEPNFRYIKRDFLSYEHQTFPDYTYETISRDFCSHLVKVTPIRLPHAQVYPTPPYYYKRIYVDGSCEAPVTEKEYQELKDIY